MLASLRIGALLCLLALAGVLAYANQTGVNARDAAAYRMLLRELQRHDRALDAELLRVSAGTVNHFDTVVLHTKARKQIARLLTQVPAYLGDDGEELRRAIEGEPGLAQPSAAKPDEDVQRVGGLMESLEDQDVLIERFKRHDSVLRHSIRYLPFAAQFLVRDVVKDHPEARLLTAELNALFTEVLLFQEFGETTSHRKQEIQDAIDALRERNVDFLEPERKSAMRLLADHAELILAKREKVDEAYKRIDHAHVADRIEQVRRVFERNHEDAAFRTIELRYAAFILSIATIVLGAAFIILRMRQAAAALSAAKAKLELANVALEAEKDKERELADLKSRFVSMTSHEFRTPLTVIGSSAELLESYGERWDEDKRAKHFGKIKTATAQMKRMLDAVLLVGKSEAGMLKFEPRALDVAELVDDVVDELQTDPNTSHTIEVNLGDEVAEAVLDERLLRHLVTNLLTNAMKYSPDATRVFLDVGVEDDELVIVVEDTGIGISPQDRERLFESYFRGDNVGTIKGTGLGLALVQTAVEQHSGRIDVQSEVGEGTTFTVRIPLDAAERAEQRESRAAE